MPRADRRKRQKDEELKASASKMAKLTSFFKKIPNAGDVEKPCPRSSLQNEPSTSSPKVVKHTMISELSDEQSQVKVSSVSTDIHQVSTDSASSLEQDTPSREKTDIVEQDILGTQMASEQSIDSMSTRSEESSIGPAEISNIDNTTTPTNNPTIIIVEDQENIREDHCEDPSTSTVKMPDELLCCADKEGIKNTESTELCQAKCCSEEKPYHPTAEEIKSCSAKQVYGKPEKVRLCPPNTFVRYPWVSFCLSRGTIFCYYCRRGKIKDLITFSKCGEDAFTSGDFCNWKKCFEKIEKHSKSHFHGEAVTKVGFRDDPKMDVSVTLHRDLQKTQETRRLMLVKQISSLRYLARQGLGIRGHSELDGNLQQLLLMRAEDVPGLRDWVEDGKYLGKEVVNELLEMMANTVLRTILEDVRQSRLFSLIADESRDVSYKEQLTCVLKWMNPNDMSVNEDFIGMYELEKTDSQTVATALKDVLIRCNLKLQDCMWQGYDGAATMAGNKSGVATRLREECPAALYLHCANHSLDLALQSMVNESKLLRNTLDCVHELAVFIKASPKRLAQYHNIAADFEDAEDLHKLCPTRWTVRTKAISAVLKSREALSQTLRQIADERKSNDRDIAEGLETKLNTFEIVFGLNVAKNVFGVSEQVATTLQKPSISAQTTVQCVKALITSLQAQRKSFEQVYDKASKESVSQPVLPRQKKVPKRLQYGSAEEHEFSSAKEHYQRLYYESIDECSNRIQERFDQPGYQVLSEIEDIILNSCNGIQLNSIPSRVKELYSALIDFDMLEAELKLLKGLFQQIMPEVKRVTDMDTVVTALTDSSCANQLLTNVKKLLHIYLIAPMSAASGERSFSVQRRLKSHMRSTMTEKRYNNLLIMHIHKQGVDALDLTAIAKKFVDRKSQRLQYFGKFL